ncbi:MAG: hypothetical protein M1834_002737 [Cirrosporium novae-zelandiae]|nr:MAG: hypothetical protein M1834_002737 [Cirrosporium novae-zelandiae]
MVRFTRPSIVSHSCVSRWYSSQLGPSAQNLLTLAIETSCDDTSVALLESTIGNPLSPAARLHFHERITADNRQYGGIHPIVSLASHESSLGPLVKKALESLPSCIGVEKAPEDGRSCSSSSSSRRIPDLIAVTRGPGMRSSISIGLELAKGLAAAWDVPLIGVNHMQAHALTPRLVSALNNPSSRSRDPAFPFLSLLVSGGHTMLVHSKSLVHHEILATTCDIAIGDCLDKIARIILPKEYLKTEGHTMYGKLLEQFAFPNPQEYNYTPPATRAEEISEKSNRWGWSLHPPFSNTGASKADTFSFSGLESSIQRYFTKTQHEICLDERHDLAAKIMLIAFEHLASRVVYALQARQPTFPQNSNPTPLTTLVIAGGVASNHYLKTILRSFLDIRGFSNIKLSFPPPSLCCDNAAMIAWAGLEMFEQGWESDLGCRALRKWSVDPGEGDGGVLGVGGWVRRKKGRSGE